MSKRDFRNIRNFNRAALPVDAKDQLGRSLRQNDVVMMPGNPSPLWRVHEISPVLHPNAPPNTVAVTLVATAQFALVTGERAEGVVLVVPAAPPEGINGEDPGHPGYPGDPETQAQDENAPSGPRIVEP